MGIRVNHVCEDCFFLRDCKDDTYLFSGGRFDKGYCTELKTFYYPNDKICVHFQNKETYTPGGCYITTMVCDMLGYEDKCHILEELRYLSDNVMQKDAKYKQALCEYDIIGPQIAKEIEIDQDYDLVNGMLDSYILPAVDMIEHKKYDEAIYRYQTMTKSLGNYYGIDLDITIPDDYNQEKGGHGKIKCIKRPEINI